MWNEEKKIWTSFTGTLLMTKTVSKCLVEHFKDQISILENATSSDLLKSDQKALQCISSNIDLLNTK